MVAARARHILVLGAGSAGKRHLRNFSALGCPVSAVDPRPERLAEAMNLVPLIQAFAEMEAALSSGVRYDGVVVCSPPSFHASQVLAALQAGLPLYLEKPPSPDAASCKRLVDAWRQTGVALLMGYTYRWWPPLLDLKARLAAGAVGRVRHIRGIMSAHLADWHPWEHYQDFYMASQTLGGGALLDESHLLDLLLWFFGMPAEVFGRVERLSALDIETDDHVDAWLAFPGGRRALLHLDLYGRPHERALTITGEEGTLHWSVDPNRLRFGRAGEQTWEDTTYTCERNDMFVSAAREFLDVIGGTRTLSCSIADGYAVLRVIEAIRQSSATGRAVRLEAADV
ncbi:MAG: Gfo/Idh/MocA family protein [bacterium]